MARGTSPIAVIHLFAEVLINRFQPLIGRPIAVAVRIPFICEPLGLDLLKGHFTFDPTANGFDARCDHLAIRLEIGGAGKRTMARNNLCDRPGILLPLTMLVIS